MSYDTLVVAVNWYGPFTSVKIADERSDLANRQRLRFIVSSAKGVMSALGGSGPGRGTTVAKVVESLRRSRFFRHVNTLYAL